MSCDRVVDVSLIGEDNQQHNISYSGHSSSGKCGYKKQLNNNNNITIYEQLTNSIGQREMCQL